MGWAPLRAAEKTARAATPRTVAAPAEEPAPGQARRPSAAAQARPPIRVARAARSPRTAAGRRSAAPGANGWKVECSAFQAGGRPSPVFRAHPVPRCMGPTPEDVVNHTLSRPQDQYGRPKRAGEYRPPPLLRLPFGLAASRPPVYRHARAAQFNPPVRWQGRVGGSGRMPPWEAGSASASGRVHPRAPLRAAAGLPLEFTL